MSSKYERLDIKSFGNHLLESGDLDPTYIALPKAIEDNDQLYRWLISYWCFYSCGFSCWASERTGKDFLEALYLAAHNETSPPIGGRWPRGKERRHARGQQGISMVNDLKLKYGHKPEDMIEYLIEGSPSYENISERVKNHVLFGPWISFKICDMLERVLSINVDFSEAHVFMFDDPVKAALMLWRESLKLPENAQPKNKNLVISEIVKHLKSVFDKHLAPPFYDRKIDLQEIETILCKWKSHRNGHYPLNNDLIEIRSSLEPWTKFSQTASSFIYQMPKEMEYANKL